MTEAEWLAATDPTPMLDFVRGKATDRKRRLFAVACCRRISDMDEKWMGVAILAAEQFADGLCGREEMERYRRLAEELAFETDDDFVEVVSVAIGRAADVDREDEVEGDDFAATSATHARFASDDQVGEKAVQSRLVKEIFGNPFRPVTIDPAWLTEPVHSLAAGIYAERAFDRMPVLADALEEAGCDSADILSHCRGDGPHVRGCWVVDLLLGKE